MAEDLTRINLANSLVTLGQGAIKAALLINGASAVAISAFVGQVFNELPTGVFASAKCAIAIFALGVALAAFSTLFAYLAQIFYYRATEKGSDKNSGNSHSRNNTAFCSRISYLVVYYFYRWYLLVFAAVLKLCDIWLKGQCQRPHGLPRADSIYSRSYPAAAKKLVHSWRVNCSMPSAITSHSSVIVLAAALRSRALSLENAISIGLKSGE